MMLPAQQKTYYGFDDSKGAVAVFVSSPGQQMRPLPLRCDIVNHSPTGFSWGYAGSGPAQLALAILADYFGCAHAARPLHQLFKFAAISGIQEKHWSIAGSDIACVFEKLCRDRPWLNRLAIFEDGQPCRYWINTRSAPVNSGELRRWYHMTNLKQTTRSS
jgi:Family of unknown function (DUF6166)